MLLEMSKFKALTLSMSMKGLPSHTRIIYLTDIPWRLTLFKVTTNVKQFRELWNGQKLALFLGGIS